MSLCCAIVNCRPCSYGNFAIITHGLHQINVQTHSIPFIAQASAAYDTIRWYTKAICNFKTAWIKFKSVECDSAVLHWNVCIADMIIGILHKQWITSDSAYLKLERKARKRERESSNLRWTLQLNSKRAIMLRISLHLNFGGHSDRQISAGSLLYRSCCFYFETNFILASICMCSTGMLLYNVAVCSAVLFRLLLL